jgi:hypothetical protein
MTNNLIQRNLFVNKKGNNSSLLHACSFFKLYLCSLFIHGGSKNVNDDTCTIEEKVTRKALHTVKQMRSTEPWRWDSSGFICDCFCLLRGNIINKRGLWSLLNYVCIIYVHNICIANCITASHYKSLIYFGLTSRNNSFIMIFLWYQNRDK